MRSVLATGFGTDEVSVLLGGIPAMLGSFFSPENFLNWRWWICMVISFAIAIHMEVSRSDIRSGLRGLLVITCMLLVADVILGLLFPSALAAVTMACMTAGAFMAFVLLIPAVFSLLIGVASLVMIFLRTSAESIKNDRAASETENRNLPVPKQKK